MSGGVAHLEAKLARIDEAMRMRVAAAEEAAASRGDGQYFAVSRAAQLEAELSRIDDDDAEATRMRSSMDAAARDECDERYRESSRVAYLEAKLDGIDEALRSMEAKLDAQIDVVDMLIDDRRGFDDDDIEGGVDDEDDDYDPPPPLSSFDEYVGFREREPPMPPPPPRFVERRGPPPLPLPPPPLPPPSPPPPPPPREGYGDPRRAIDDGRAYYQERNYGREDIASSSQRQSGKSANERSEGHYYDQRNDSFISAFSKMDNQRRREFRPFADERLRGNAIGANDDARSSRGVRSPPNRGYSSMPPPSMMMPEYFDGMPYFRDEDGPMMMMEEDGDYYYDNGMYQF